MSHWKKHIVLFQTLDAAVQRPARTAQALPGGRERWGALLGCLAGVQRGDAGTPQPGAWMWPPWSPGDAVVLVGPSSTEGGIRAAQEPPQADRGSVGDALGPM